MQARKWLVAVSSLCLFAAVASAEWQRTIRAEDTRLPAKGKLQMLLEGGYEAWSEDEADGRYTYGQLQLNYGIADNWAAYVAPGIDSWDVENEGSETGLSDTGVGSVYRFLNEAEVGLDLALQGAIRLPTGDEDKWLGSGKVEPELHLLVSKTLGPVMVVANAGGTLILDADEGEKDFVVQGVVEGIYPLNEQWSLNAALTAESAHMDGADDDVDLDLGARFTPTPSLVFMGGYTWCLADIVDWVAFFGAGYEF